MRPAQNRAAAAEGGFVLIEVLVSALVLVIASAGVVAVLQTTVHSQSEERRSSQAYALAQEDQARLASMRLANLNRLDQTRTVSLGGTEFKVRSIGVFVNDKTSTPSCGEGTASADYVQITSLVSWPGMSSAEKAKIESILSPSNGSLDPNNGTIAISVKNKPQVPMPNVSVSGGSGAFSGLTDAAGCAVFPDLPAGPYLTTISGAAAGLVNKEGKSSMQETLSAVGGDVRTYNFEFDRPGKIQVKFKYRIGSGGTFQESPEQAKADSVVVRHSELKEGKVFGTPGGTRLGLLEPSSLYPFSSAYTLFAGSCASNDPDPKGENPGAAAAKPNVLVTAGGVASATIQLPALELFAKQSGAALQGARVTLTDTVCKDAQGNFLKRTYTSNAAGLPSSSESGKEELGVPWGTYNVCVSKSNRMKTLSNLAVTNLTAATTATVDLGSGYSSGSCP